MNPPTTSASAHETAHLEKLRAQISTDIETMQQKEASLKEYEQRLRLLVEHAHENPPAQPAPHNNQYFVTAGPDSQAALDAEWDKYNRAHALLEAARRGLTDDRLALKEREEQLARREEQVARREAWVKAREQEIAAAGAAKTAAPDSTPSFATSSFRAARNFFNKQS